MTCRVFVVVPSREQLRAIVAEVWRVLRPGGLADPADLDAWDYEVERRHAPFLLIHGCKPGT
jgi:hypothetical protein